MRDAAVGRSAAGALATEGRRPDGARVSTTPICPQCGKELDSGHHFDRCDYCGWKRPADMPGAAPGTARRSESPGMGAPPFAAWLLLAAFLSVIAIYPVLRWVAAPSGPPPVPKWMPTGPVVWDPTHRPHFVDVDGDGTLDVVGRFRLDESAGTGLQVGAFSGRDGHVLWATPSLGDWVDSFQKVDVAISPPRLLVSGIHRQLRLLNLSSGQQLQLLSVPTDPTQICGQPGRLRFYVVTAEGDGAMVDPVIPQPTPGPRPTWCAPRDEREGLVARAMPESALPEGHGLTAPLVINQGTAALALGRTERGWEALAFDPDRKTISWRASLGPVQGEGAVAGELVDGSAALVLPLPQGGRELVVLSMEGGAVRWRTSLESIGGSPGWATPRLVETQLWVAGLRSLSVFELAAGKPLFRVGR